MHIFASATKNDEKRGAGSFAGSHDSPRPHPAVPGAAFTPASLHRKSACSCGGGCNSCQNARAGSPQMRETSDSHDSIVRRERSGDAPARVPSSVMAAVNSPGKPLPESFRRSAEKHFDKDLSHVRIHDDSIAATAAAESRAHALTIGSDILLSRKRSDLSGREAQKTLAHEVTHTLQPSGGSYSHFEPDGSPAEVEASAAAESFVSSFNHKNRTAIHRSRRGVVRDRDPRLDRLVEVIEAMPLVLSGRGIAEELELVAPGLDLDDPDNYEPLTWLLDGHFGPGTGAESISEWQALQSQSGETRVTPRPAERRSPGRSTAPPVAVVSAVPPASMTATHIESEIELIREALGMPPLNVDAPETALFEPGNSDDERRLERLTVLEAEYFDRRRLLEGARETTRAIAAQQREGIGVLDVLQTTTSILVNPTMIPATIASEVLGNPVEDFATGFLPGFLGGAVLELPRDVFTRLDAETRAHPIQFNGGVLVGIPVGAVQGLWELLVGLYELLQIAEHLTPTGLTRAIVEEAIRAAADEQHASERMRQLRQAQAIGEAIVALIGDMITDPAFMLAHGEELGEIAGRAAGDWFSTDFMARSTFDKGYLVGRVEGRILFEIVALFLGPEEWIARGATLIGQGARISSRLSRAIIEFIERIPALRRLLTAGREATTIAREARAGERALAETGEAISDVSRLGDEATDITRAGERAEDVAGRGRVETPASGALDPGDLRRVGEVNPETLQFFRRHPDRLRGWAENPVARRACKLCSSPCFPENVTRPQTQRLEALLNRAERQGLTVEEHILHDELARMSESQIDDFIASFEQHLDEMPTDLTSVIDEATEAAASRSPNPEDIPEVPSTGREAEERAADLAEARLTPREPWRPPPGATPRPPDSAPLTDRVEWLRERLQMHVDDAVEHFRAQGLTTAQEQALLDNPQMYPAFRGSRIDQFAKDTIMQDLELGDLITAPDFVAEPDVLSSAMPDWFDITTANAWQAHLQRYAARYGTGGVLLPTQ